MRTMEELKNEMDKITGEMELLRKESPYLLTCEDDGQNFPIPDLIGSERLILVDDQTRIPSRIFTYGICTFAPRTSLHKKHRHANCEELMYIISGRGIGGVGEHETMQKAGDTLFVPENVDHWFYNPFDEPCRMIWIYSEPSLRAAGYSLESRGYNEIDHEKEYFEIKK